MESEIIDTDVQAKVEVQCGNHIYGQYIAEKVENLIKKHGSIKADEILDNIDEKIKDIENIDKIKDDFEDRIEYLNGEIRTFEYEITNLEDEVESLEAKIESSEDVDGVSVEVSIKSENAIVAEWVSLEVTRVINKYGTAKAYEIFKNIN